MIVLKKAGVLVDRDDVERLTADFQRNQCARLPGLLESSLATYVAQRLEQGPWTDMVHKDISLELISMDHPAVNLLHLAMNSTAFLNAMREVSGCDAISWFGGRVYRMIPNCAHYDDWHTDTLGDRVVGLSLNLSSNLYSGGVF